MNIGIATSNMPTTSGKNGDATSANSTRAVPRSDRRKRSNSFEIKDILPMTRLPSANHSGAKVLAMHRSFRKIRQFLPVSVIALGLGACATTTASQSSQQVSVESMLRVADLTRSGGDLVNAVGLYQRAHELAPQDERPLVALGQIFAQLGSPAGAAEAYRAAVAAAPSDVEARRGLGTALIAMGHPDVAITELEKALDIAKDYRIYNSLGVAYDMTGDHASAQTYYQTGLALSPGNLELSNNLGLSLALDGRYDEAIALLEKISNDPNAPSRYRQNLALAFGLAGNRDKARQVAQQDLDYATAEKNLSYFDMLKGLGDDRTMAAALGVHMLGSDAAADAAASGSEFAAPAAGSNEVVPLQSAPAAEPAPAPSVLNLPAPNPIESQPLPPTSQLESAPAPAIVAPSERVRSPAAMMVPAEPADIEPAAGVDRTPLPTADIDRSPLSEPRSERVEPAPRPATGGPARFEELPEDRAMEETRPPSLSALLEPPHEVMLSSYTRPRDRIEVYAADLAQADPVIQVPAFLAAGPSETDFTGSGLYDPSGFDASRFAR